MPQKKSHKTLLARLSNSRIRMRVSRPVKLLSHLGMGLFGLWMMGIPMRREAQQKALWRAIMSDDVAAARSALDHGADPDSHDEYSLYKATPCDWGGACIADPRNSLFVLAVERSSADMVRLLLDRGADVGGEDHIISHGQKLNGALGVSGKNRHVEVAKILLDLGAEKIEIEGAFLTALYSHNFEVCDLLLKNGLDVNTGFPLHSQEGGEASIAYLVSRGADINRRGYAGYTALMSAAISGYSDTVRLLLKYHADPTLRDRDGKTALMHARQSDDQKVVEVLTKLTPGA